MSLPWKGGVTYCCPLASVCLPVRHKIMSPHDRSKAVLLLWIIYVFSVLIACVVWCLIVSIPDFCPLSYFVFVIPLCASVYLCLDVTCWERADLLAFVCCVLLQICHFPIGILGQVWYLIVSIPDLCTLTYFDKRKRYINDTSYICKAHSDNGSCTRIITLTCFFSSNYSPCNVNKCNYLSAL